ncbi:MAG: hypothetical protein FWC50_13065 [Planctomycetaceae bacterium]|nr:hypothetical protein [Planctomycetaceae bacterium]
MLCSRFEIPEATVSPASQGGCMRPKAAAHTGCGIRFKKRLRKGSFLLIAWQQLRLHGFYHLL